MSEIFRIEGLTLTVQYQFWDSPGTYVVSLMDKDQKYMLTAEAETVVAAMLSLCFKMEEKVRDIHFGVTK